jgi:hypothetical protein
LFVFFYFGSEFVEFVWIVNYREVSMFLDWVIRVDDGEYIYAYNRPYNKVIVTTN